MDPFATEDVGLGMAKEMADIVTISHDHGDHNNKESVTGPAKRQEVFVIDKVGEYEIGGIEISAIRTFHDKTEGSERGRNLITVVRMDNLAFCHLGDLGHKLSEGTIEKMGSVDVLMIPVGGVYTIDAQEAVDMIKEIQPSVVIPMHYKVDGMTSQFSEMTTLELFLDKCKLPVMEERLHKTKIDESSLPDDTQIMIMNA